MKRDEFIKLGIEAKLAVLWDQGEVISEKSYYDSQITLFLLEDYYVEVFFSPFRNEITGIEIQHNRQILYGYVSDLSLDALIKLLL